MQTDNIGLDAGEIRIPTSDGAVPGYRAMPSGAKSPPVVLVVQEIFGVNDHIKDVCRRLAKTGYLAIAPELFARQADVSKMQDIQEIVGKVVSKVPDAQVMSDLDAAVNWAANTGNADTARLGITGFCWGGRIVWLYAAHSNGLKAGAAWYGQIEGQKNEARTRTALDVAPGVKAPVIGFYGDKDQGIPLAQVEKMQEALRKTGTGSHIIVYPDAGHAFFADYRPSYREADASDAWAHMLEWFRKHGVA
jgi:carboxymethylenebutenolidase